MSSEGVVLTQIRALRQLTPTERVRALVATVRNLKRLKQNVRVFEPPQMLDALSGIASTSSSSAASRLGYMVLR